jgi:hypothetical protein
MRAKKTLKSRVLAETEEYVLVEDKLLGVTPLYVIYWKHENPHGYKFFPRGHSTKLDFEASYPFGIPSKWEKLTGEKLDRTDIIIQTEKIDMTIHTDYIGLELWPRKDP